MRMSRRRCGGRNGRTFASESPRWRRTDDCRLEGRAPGTYAIPKRRKRRCHAICRKTLLSDALLSIVVENLFVNLCVVFREAAEHNLNVVCRKKSLGLAHGDLGRVFDGVTVHAG